MPDLSGLRCTYLPYWSQGFLEEVIVELLKAGTSQRLRQVHTFSQTLNLHSDLQADAAAEYVPKRRACLSKLTCVAAYSVNKASLQLRTMVCSAECRSLMKPITRRGFSQSVCSY